MTPPAAAAVKFPSPEAYTPKHLAERIINSKAAVEGSGAENGVPSTGPLSCLAPIAEIGG
jgi:hypothetical protein